MSNNWLFKISIAFILLIDSFLMYVFFSEFYMVGIYKKSNGAYAFGNVNENQWYYQSAKIYSLYNLSVGLIFLIPTIFLVYSLLKSKQILIEKTTLILCLIILIFFVLKF